MRTRINFNLYHHYNSFHVNESLRNLYKIPRNSSINFQKTFFSTNKQDKSNNNSNNNVETKQLIFEGPNFRLIRILKIFSISTFGFAWTICPLTWWNWNNPMIQAAELNEIILSLAFVASTASTITLHNFMSPYVTKIFYHHTPSIIPSTSQISNITPLTKITLETLSIFSHPIHITLQLKDLKSEINRITLRWKVKNDYLINCEKNGIKIPSQTKFWIDYKNFGKGKEKDKEKEILDKIIKVVNENNSTSLL
ncbi:hypothetical protein RhiirA5_499562 [Rhizophagus irregularis]|uniref:Uncharacterized protein n=2 Tax=Rhizophagus irregularis TaxID=588596 RepID=A0A2N0PQD2_9GLOM|nr:hypothetical protein RirG_217160 [Rhizophagus irregularis DAOM 197198w]PKC08999.1 hypothetical protein RhiirA5_499562 [Rhizophagus irregularis]GBC35173.1 hypothetical protein GLOIN_2v1689055 [Rhizophagus irregularis DAOM 181602=DAOM 197198]PKC61611.1 hypothetical protein RhiirA1_539060 [Rhizophagus irregularis]UZO29592.1 hypothetical protein OCT59_023056 [Rhizophagus irregularis]